MGVYRAAFTSIKQTESLRERQVRVPIVALGGEKGLGGQVGESLTSVAVHVDSQVLPGCGHFLPEQRPDAVVDHVLRAVARGVRTRS